MWRPTYYAASPQLMPPRERDKASVVASKHFCRLLLALQADGGCTHLAFTDGSKVGEEASKDGGTRRVRRV